MTMKKNASENTMEKEKNADYQNYSEQKWLPSNTFEPVLETISTKQSTALREHF